MTTLIIARHGNTFEAGETPRRVGLRTDMPLTDKGREQARAIGRWLREQRLLPDVVYSSTLKRTIETAKLAIRESGLAQPVFPLEIFNEIDYGPDENRTEQELLDRIGADALRQWETHGIVPDGWSPDADAIIEAWTGFATHIRAHDDNETVLVVTSNGIARFAPYVTGDFNAFAAAHDIKLSTGGIGVLVHRAGKWDVTGWNIRPGSTQAEKILPS